VNIYKELKIALENNEQQKSHSGPSFVSSVLLAVTAISWDALKATKKADAKNLSAEGELCSHRWFGY